MDHITSGGNMINVVTPGVVRRPDQRRRSINKIPMPPTINGQAG
jgi:hypothetical protein